MTKQKDRHDDSTDTITIRVPTPLKQRIISLANKRETTVNAWCLNGLSRIAHYKPPAIDSNEYGGDNNGNW